MINWIRVLIPVLTVVVGGAAFFAVKYHFNVEGGLKVANQVQEQALKQALRQRHVSDRIAKEQRLRERRWRMRANEYARQVNSFSGRCLDDPVGPDIDQLLVEITKTGNWDSVREAALRLLAGETPSNLDRGRDVERRSGVAR